MILFSTMPNIEKSGVDELMKKSMIRTCIFLILTFMTIHFKEQVPGELDEEKTVFQIEDTTYLF